MLTMTRPREAMLERPAPHAERFGRLFSRRPFADPTPEVRDALLDMGRAGGLLDDRGEGLTRGNGAQPAGAAFAVQFLSHDVTCGASAAFDLAAIYGGGPVQSADLYDPVDRGKLRVETGGLFEDVPRTSNGKAVLGDRRNDENLVLGGLHAALLLAHNHCLDIMRARRGRSRGGEDVFGQAQRVLRWHYQWMIVHELLPLLVGEPMVTSVLTYGRRLFTSPRAWVPVEFQAIFKAIGYSMLVGRYRANLGGDAGRPFEAPLFDRAASPSDDPSDLRGGVRAARRFVGWQSFFDFGDGQVDYGRCIAPGFAAAVFDDGSPNLLQRLLVRHQTWELPSGQAIARALRVPAMCCPELAAYGLGVEHNTPLLYYVLAEAQSVEGGRCLGPVGARIVAEVVLGLVQRDRTSYLNVRPDWRPTLPSQVGRSQFRMVDLLAFAGVDPTSRGQ
jgi:hypothetical protein